MAIRTERGLSLRRKLIALLAGVSLSAPMPIFPMKNANVPEVRAQWRKLMPLREALDNALPEEDDTRVFSPFTPPEPGAALVSWQPGGRGGEMRLTVNWAATPELFVWLAACGMRAMAFSLRPEKDALLLILQLEKDDAR